ncbi:MAG: diaminobutyrate--2-oxoglutarate transaminase [Myxococcota bacterium]|jgi:diaminobutyrate-2-oxoglutarate transaminase|nr:diaminobutyrate--2-oxoglutarate transaminase [Myxococcota bacterium]
MIPPVFERLESEVRGYCRSFPTVFTHAEGATLRDAKGRTYLDFFAGAGALNYGHSHPVMRDALIAYLQSGGVVHTLDLHTAAKARFLETFEQLVLRPRKLDWKVMFPGPTGTNAVEAALKLARKVTGRTEVVSFTNGFHGMTLGALAVTGNAGKRAGAGVPLGHAQALPYDGYLGDSVDTLDLFEHMLRDGSSGLDLPAAVILETVQAEGGVNVASPEWLRRLRKITAEHGVLLVVDDIQVGCGRTGPFFSFERAGIEPDVVTLSKSLSGFGLPFALTMFRRDLDVWSPGEHNGTFRGFNLAMVTATTALETFWRDDTFARATERKAALVSERLHAIAEVTPFARGVRGLGMIRGLECTPAARANEVSKAAYERGLVIETAGPNDEVVKLLPPLTIDEAELAHGLDVLAESFAHVARTQRRRDDDATTTVATRASSTTSKHAEPVVHAGARRDVEVLR